MAAYGVRGIVSAVEAGRRLGFELRAKQQEAVLNFVRGHDVFVSLPTGSGKSLCYGVLPWTFDTLRKTAAQSIVIVVSPLVTLMEDQVASFTRKGVKAVHVKKEETMSEETVEEIREGDYQLLFLVQRPS